MPDEQRGSPSPALSAVIPALRSESEGLAETLLSLAAQTVAGFTVMVVLADASPDQLGNTLDLVHQFDDGFVGRVQVVAGGAAGATPLSVALARSRARYVAPLDPGDVAMAHWAETFLASMDAADGGALVSLVATQRVEGAGDAAVTTISRPRVEVRSAPFNLATHLSGPPDHLHGIALPRTAARDCMPTGITARAEAWAMLLVMALTRGFHHTGAVTVLRREEADTGRAEGGEWRVERDAALAMIEAHGVALGPGAPGTLTGGTSGTFLTDGAAGNGAVRITELREALVASQEETTVQSSARASLQDRVGALQGWRGWKLAEPLRRLGSLVRRGTRPRS